MPKTQKAAKDDGERRLFFDSIVEECVAGVNLEGLAGEIAKRVAPKVFASVSVEKIADEIVERHEEELAAEISAAIVAKLLGR
jgi:hypothetical protein